MASILLVDDQPANLLALEVVLSPLGQRLVRATSGEEALARLRQEEFAVVLLDVMMPGMDGLLTADRIRSQPGGGEMPIIFVTASDIPALEGYAHGAVDYVRKPFDRNIVRAKVAVFVELYRARTQLRRHAVHLAEQERRAQARTAALLNTSLDAIIGMDHNGCITEFNATAEAMFGYHRQDVINRLTVDLLLPARHREAYHLGLAHYLATGESRVLDTRVEIRALRANGAEFPIELAVRRVDEEGLPTFLGYVRDLSDVYRDRAERKRTEEVRAFLAQASDAFAESIDYEATLRTIVGLAVPHMADWCAVDLLGDGGAPLRVALAHADPAKVKMGEELRMRYPLDHSAPHGVARVLRTGRFELYEDISDSLLKRIARDDEHLELLRGLGMRSLMTVPITARGHTLGAITFVAAESGRHYDSSDLNMAQDLARRAAAAFENAQLYRATQMAEARNRFLAEATEALAASLDYATTLERVARLAVPMIADMAAVYRLEADATIRLIALAAKDPAQEAAARELDALLPLSVDQQDRLLPRVVRTGRAEVLAELPQPMRQVWSPSPRARELMTQLAIHSYMVVPLMVRGRALGAMALTALGPERRFGTGELALAEELGRRAGIAIENAQLYSEAQEASRLKDEFLATVSHELRTPLSAIVGWTHILRKGDSAHLARAIESIDRNAQAQVRIVDDVLDVSRIVTGKLRLELEPVSLVDIVQAAIDTVQSAAAAKEITMAFAHAPQLEKTLADAARLQQVAWNLLANAIKFTPKGGRVEVSLESDESNIYLAVNDTGVGIRPEFLPYVFDRFRQADSSSTRAFGGLGLGLAIVRHLVELHGGQVAAESDGPGKGARFAVALPIRRVARGAESGASPSGSASDRDGQTQLSLHGIRVLVVDDEPDARDLVAAVLEYHGAEVTTAASARTAQDVISHAPPDVLVSDIGMPGEDGYAFIREVRARGSKSGFWFPAVALTAYAQPEDRERTLLAGYQMHLTKPIEPKALIAAIVELAGRNVPPHI